MNMLHSSPRLHRLIASTGILFLAGGSLHAAEWNGGGADLNWSTLSNWDSAPAGSSVLFTSEGATGTPNVSTNIVDSSLTIDSLTYQYNSPSLGHLTEITSGNTLTVSGSTGSSLLLVGGQTITGDSVLNTSASISGDGTLVVSGTGKEIVVANHRLTNLPDNPATANLDMSGLAVFQASLGSTGSFNIGSSLPSSDPGANQMTRSVVRLAEQSSITTGNLRIGSVAVDAQISTGNIESELRLNRDTTLNANTILVATGRASRATGAIRFDSAALDHSPTARLRGSDGTAAVATFYVGVNQFGTSNAQRGEVDFSGGEVDLHVTDLLIGAGRGSGSSAQAFATGIFTMDAGEVVAQNITVGESGSSTNLNAVNLGTLNIDGGRLEVENLLIAHRAAGSQQVLGTVNLTGSGEIDANQGIVMGRQSAGAAATTIAAVLNIDGGTLTSGGDIARASAITAISATLRLRGGTLDLQGNDIDVNTLTLESGRLHDIGEINAGADIVKTTGGTLELTGTHLYGGTTDVTAGRLDIGGTLQNSEVIIRSGASLSGSGTLTAGATLEESSSLAFDLRSASDYDSLAIGALLIGDNVDLVLDLQHAPLGSELYTLISGNYTGSFATINGNAFSGEFTLEYGGTDYLFQLNYGANAITLQSAIPEPGSMALFGAAAVLLGLRRRNLRA